MKKLRFSVLSFLLVLALLVPSFAAFADVGSSYTSLATDTYELATEVLTLYKTGGIPTPDTMLNAAKVVWGITELSLELANEMDSAMTDWLEAHLIAYDTSLNTYLLGAQGAYEFAEEDTQNNVDPTTREQMFTIITESVSNGLDQNIRAANKMLSDYSAWFLLHGEQKKLVEATKENSQELKDSDIDFYELYLRLRDEAA